VKAPSERKLKDVERELKKLPRGTQRKVGGGIYMRLDKSGRRRFQFRTRAEVKSASQPAGTFDSWESAAKALAKLEERAGKLVDETVDELRQLTIAQYYDDHYLPHIEDNLDSLTQVDYTGKFERDCRSFWSKYTFEDIDSSPIVADRFRTHLKNTHTFPALDEKGKPHPRAGQLFSPSACDGAIKVMSALFTHAGERGLLKFNPMKQVKRFRTRRRNNMSPASGGSQRQVRRKEMRHPRVTVRIGAAARGFGAQLEERRGLVDVLGFVGARPSEAIGIRHRSWRNPDGSAKDHLEIEEAVKEPWGHIEVGDPKTGERDPYLPAAVAEQLERIYQAQGCPSLDALTFPNAFGAHLSWTNWRSDIWYPMLMDSGIAVPPEEWTPPVKDGKILQRRQWGISQWTGAFRPYDLRHCVASMMFHARRHDGEGRYTVLEIANQLGHDPRTLLGVYAKVMHDINQVAGLTMDEIIRAARREVWGPLPGDPDFEDEWLTTDEASLLTGISVNALGNRIHRGAFPAEKRGSSHLISRHTLRWYGLIPLDTPQAAAAELLVA
jgi:integrase